ncbi:MAG: hypothetical protein K8S16_04595 [Bacteroidales bacterium]|nr:hypothetical protein [Bacteroidales bacterium]
MTLKNKITSCKVFVNENISFIANLLFLSSLAIFILDCIFNYFFHLPVFVGFSLFLLPLLFICIILQSRNHQQFLLIAGSFLLVSFISSYVNVFHVKNISDLVFILFFITVLYLYIPAYDGFKEKNGILLFLISLILFSFSFFGIDGRSYPNSEQIENLLEPVQKIKWEFNPLDKLESERNYRQGLFRLSHIASYFFGFMLIYFSNLFWAGKKKMYLLMAAVSLFLCFYSGSRTVLAAIAISLIIFLARKKYIIYFQSAIIAVLLLILFRKFFMHLFDNTFLYQYFTFFETATENYERLSRFRIWNSWWKEVKGFELWNFFIGKSYINALITNNKNLNYTVWFHNDFLNIFYSYGLWCVALYIWLFIKIYRDYKLYIRQNVFIFVFYFSIIITAFVNGFYYYFPVFLMYLFFLMIKNEKQQLRK